jgi:hypothetical protein
VHRHGGDLVNGRVLDENGQMIGDAASGREPR